MSKFVGIIAGGVEIAAGIALEFVPGGQILGGFLIAAGAGQVIAGIGTLLNQPRGLGTATRNPIAPWTIIYGRAKVGGTVVYVAEWGDNNKYLDLVLVLAGHQCESVDALLFDNQHVQIDPTTGTSFTPVQQTVSISSITRKNGVVTVVLPADIPLLVDGDRLQIENVSTDATLNGVFSIDVLVQNHGSPGDITVSYISGGSDVVITGEGDVKTLWPDYRAKVYMEVLKGNQVTTFVGMTAGTPNDGDTGDLIGPSPNPWIDDHKILGKCCVFLRLHYNDAVFAGGLPTIAFRVKGKQDIYDPRIPGFGYTENAALCIADFLHNTTWGLRAGYGDTADVEIPTAPLIAAANICDEDVQLASPVTSPPTTEPRYACNGVFQLTTKRGEILQNLLTSCGGRLTYVAGQFVIHPAIWEGTDTHRQLVFSTQGEDSAFAFPFTRVVDQTIDSHADGTYPGTRYQQIYDSGSFSEPITITQLVFFAFSRGTVGSIRTGHYKISMSTTFNAEVNDMTNSTAAYPGPSDADFDSNLGDDNAVFWEGDLGGPFTEDKLIINADTPFFYDLNNGNLLIDIQVSSISGSPDYVSEGFSGGLATSNGKFSISTNFGPGFYDSGPNEGDPLENSGLVTAFGYGDPPSSPPTIASLILPGSILMGPLEWRPKVPVRDLFNGVKGTYVSPVNNWAVSDFPPYAQDDIHGYPDGDLNLALDGNERRWCEIQLPFTISAATAQRLAKIELMRRRQQGTGTFRLNMAGYQYSVLDVLSVTFPYFGWADKILEISAHRLTLEKQENGVTLLGTELDVQETDPSVYDWSVTEELTPQGYQQAGVPSGVTPEPPSSPP